MNGRGPVFSAASFATVATTLFMNPFGMPELLEGTAVVERPSQSWPLSNLWQQSDNVPFEQSRNVLLTAPSFGDAGRTTTNDPSR